MEVNILQVGKRWFRVAGSNEKGNPIINVEATLRQGIDYIENEEKSRYAGYKVIDWVDVNRWTLTGKGSNAYRQEIVEALNQHLLGEGS